MLVIRFIAAGLVLFGVGCEFTTGPLPTEDTEASDTRGATADGSGTTPGVQSDASTGDTGGSESSGSDSLPTGGEVDPPGSCCDSTRTPGCVDPEVEACVCDVDRFCCDVVWDAECAAKVVAFGCGICEGIDPREENTGRCCDPGAGGVGCAEPELEQCVCDVDPFCCEVEWDLLCADLVEEVGCGSCSPPYEGPACCNVQPGPSCESPEVAACVCARDAYCCEVQWDGQCVAHVEEMGCGPCDGSGDTADGSDSDASSSSSGSSGSSWTTQTE